MSWEWVPRQDEDVGKELVDAIDQLHGQADTIFGSDSRAAKLLGQAYKAATEERCEALTK